MNLSDVEEASVDGIVSISSLDSHPKSLEPPIEDLCEQSFQEDFQFLFNEQKEDENSESSKYTIIPSFFEESRITLKHRLTRLFES